MSPPAATPVAMPTNTDTGARAPISPHMGTFGPDGQTWGPAWGGDSRNGQIFEVRKGAGQISGGQGVFTALTGQTSSTVSVTATGTMSQFQQGATNFGIIARALDTHNLYKLYIDGSFLVLQKRVAGQATILAQTPFAAQDGVSYTLSLQAQGNTLSGRVWASASPSPVNPMVTASDASLASGQAGVRVQLQPTTVVTFTAFQVR